MQPLASHLSTGSCMYIAKSPCSSTLMLRSLLIAVGFDGLTISCSAAATEMTVAPVVLDDGGGGGGAVELAGWFRERVLLPAVLGPAVRAWAGLTAP